MQYLRRFVFSYLLLAPLLSLATADGPDYYRLNSDTPIEIKTEQRADAEIILTIPGNTNGLKNLGCKGLPNYAQWLEMTNAERLAAREQAWCQVEYIQLAGWIPQKYLVEGAHPTPSFDCDKAEAKVETLICQEADLMTLDNHMHYVYQSALQAAGNIDAGAVDGVNVLKATQRGWIKGRNECWKAIHDVKQCVIIRYQQRIAKLQTKWMLVEAGDAYRYTCGSAANEFYLTLFNTDTLPTIALEYGDNRVVMLLTQTASGTKYEGEFGRYVWLKGDEATFVWEQYVEPMHCVKDDVVQSK